MEPEQETTWSVSEVIREIDRLDGTAVRVGGTLVVPAEGACLVGAEVPVEPPARPWEAPLRLSVEVPDLLDRLLGEVPPYVGGPYGYCDDAILLGTVIRRPDDVPALTDVRHLSLRRRDERYEVQLSG